MIGLAYDKDTFDKEGVMKNDMFTYIQFSLKKRKKEKCFVDGKATSEGQLLDH